MASPCSNRDSLLEPSSGLLLCAGPFEHIEVAAPGSLVAEPPQRDLDIHSGPLQQGDGCYKISQDGTDERNLLHRGVAALRDQPQLRVAHRTQELAHPLQNECIFQGHTARTSDFQEAEECGCLSPDVELVVLSLQVSKV
eukprot:CAMPEP_0173226284 /NCGR_PEP_ID=MMETSP1142-20121109/5355_1 /TAXON_ID=483371 /ORGANISM="non described non described, Strain CCMP2298" /LENGTH=139 /DNA_ID=CAMNT_0014154737 /DNA_START=957 /DNA_END=1376 /DNA_ORIENTATION=-